MARRKKIYRDKEYERDLRREKIREYVTYVFIIALISTLSVVGLNQNNDTIVGWGIIILGLLCIGYVVFDILTRLYEWKIFTRWDSEDFKGKEVLGEDRYSEILEEEVFGRNLLVFLLSVMGVAMIVFGILRLIGKI